MNIESAVPSFEKPFMRQFEAWGEDAVSVTLFGIALLLIWIAFKKDHLILKSVLLTYILLP